MIEIKYRFGGKTVAYKDNPAEAFYFMGVLESLEIKVISVSYCLVLT